MSEGVYPAETKARAMEPSSPPDDEPSARDGGSRRARSESDSLVADIDPGEMGTLSPEEWADRFDTSAWVTGTELIDRVELELQNRIATRDVFAELERPGPDRLLAYSDEGYAIVYDDGSVEGDGTVFRDVKTSVVLAASPEYDVSAPPADWRLPEPSSIRIGGSELGNRMLQVLGAGLLLSGIAMLVGSAIGVAGRSPIILVFMGFAFLIGGIFLFFVVANARLSTRFRAAEYRNRLEAAKVGDDGRPEFVPTDLERPPKSDEETHDIAGNRTETDETRG